jgi:drug/metabolite transporter (DMT)-like permease
LKQNLKAHLAIIGANTIYGLNYVIAKGIMPDFLLPRALIFLRVSGSLVLFWILHFFLPSKKVEKRDLLKMAVCAVSGVGINQILFFEGLNLTTPISGSIIVTVIPVLILVFSHFILKDKITTVKVVGIVLGAAGALMVILSAGVGNIQFDALLGNLLIFANTIFWALYLVLVKPLMQKYDSVTVMKWTFLFGFIFISPFSFRAIASSSFLQIPFEIWMSILFVVFITTGFAYYLISYSLKTVSANVNGIYIYLQPLVAAIVAIIWGKDKLTIIDLIATVLIMAGVFLVTRQPSLKNLTQ